LASKFKSNAYFFKASWNVIRFIYTLFVLFTKRKKNQKGKQRHCLPLSLCFS
jgi:hypothetical protein